MDVGTSNPICARVAFQPEQILDSTYAPQELRERIYGANFEMTLRFTNGHKVLSELQRAFNTSLSTYLKNLPTTPNYVPSIIRVDDYAERLLMNFKMALLAFGNLLSALFQNCPIDFSETMNDVTKLDHLSQTKLVRWSEAKFGAASQFAILARASSASIRELVSKRNASEHPGGKNGTLEVINVTRVAGLWKAPTWQRAGVTSAIADDMNQGIYALVDLAEAAVLAFAETCFILTDTTVREIPANERSEAAPVRYEIIARLSQPRPNLFV